MRLPALPLAFVLSMTAAVVGADTQQKLNQVDRELGQVKSWLKDARAQQSVLLKVLREIETEQGRLTSQIDTLRSDLRSGERHHANLLREQSRLQDEIESQKQYLFQQIRSSFMSGQQEYLKLLLNQSEPEVVLRMLKYYEYFHRARLERIRDYQQKLARLEATGHELAASNARLVAQRKQLDDELSALRNARKARLEAVRKLESSIHERDEQRRRLDRDRAQLEALIETMRHSIPDMPAPSSDSPFASRKGKLDWPAGGRLGRTDSKLHENGVFLRAPAGREVRAVHHGQVVFADWMRRFGMLVIIDHGDGYMSLYAHNESLRKNAGEWVRAGEVIARVGDSGGQPDSGLYFEIRHDGKPQNPRQWCLARR